MRPLTASLRAVGEAIQFAFWIASPYGLAMTSHLAFTASTVIAWYASFKDEHMHQVRRFISIVSLILPLITQAQGDPKYYCQSGDTHYRAVDLDTILGLVRIVLFEKQAPLTTENFIYYVNQGFYDNTVIHEIQDQYILRAGLYGADFTPKSPLKEPIANESGSGIKHKAMRVAMWRETSPTSATSSFFINLKDNPNLNIPKGYTVFGEVIKGKDRVKRMQYQFSCHHIPTEDTHCHPIVIYSAKLVNLKCPG